MRVLTKNLIGPTLDLAMAACEGYKAAVDSSGCVVIRRGHVTDYFDPSSNWGWGGPIIEREGISTMFHDNGHWTAANLKGTVCEEGSTPLIAGSRCFVASKLGDEVDIPEELCDQPTT